MCGNVTFVYFITNVTMMMLMYVGVLHVIWRVCDFVKRNVMDVFLLCYTCNATRVTIAKLICDARFMIVRFCLSVKFGL